MAEGTIDDSYLNLRKETHELDDLVTRIFGEQLLAIIDNCRANEISSERVCDCVRDMQAKLGPSDPTVEDSYAQRLHLYRQIADTLRLDLSMVILALQNIENTKSKLVDGLEQLQQAVAPIAVSLGLNEDRRTYAMPDVEQNNEIAQNENEPVQRDDAPQDVRDDNEPAPQPITKDDEIPTDDAGHKSDTESVGSDVAVSTSGDGDD